MYDNIISQPDVAVDEDIVMSSVELLRLRQVRSDSANARSRYAASCCDYQSVDKQYKLRPKLVNIAAHPARLELRSRLRSSIWQDWRNFLGALHTSEMSHSLALKRAATVSIKKLDLPLNLRAKALAFAASNSEAGIDLRDLIELNNDDDLESAIVSFLEQQAGGTARSVCTGEPCLSACTYRYWLIEVHILLHSSAHMTVYISCLLLIHAIKK